MFKKFLLVTTALVAVHASDPHAEGLAAQNALEQYIASMRRMATGTARDIRDRDIKIADLESDLAAATAGMTKIAQLQQEIVVIEKARDAFSFQFDQETAAHGKTKSLFSALDTQFQQASSDLIAANAAVLKLQDELKLAQDGGLSTASSLQQQLDDAKQLADDKQLELTAMQSERDALQKKLGDAEALLESSKDELLSTLPYGGEEFYQSSLANIIEAVKKIVVNEQSLGMLKGMLPGRVREEAWNMDANGIIALVQAQHAEKSAAAEAPRRSNLDGIIAEILAKARYSDADGVEDLLLGMLPVLDQNRIRANRPGYYELIGRLIAGAIDIR